MNKKLINAYTNKVGIYRSRAVIEALEELHLPVEVVLAKVKEKEVKFWEQAAKNSLCAELEVMPDRDRIWMMNKLSQLPNPNNIWQYNQLYEQVSRVRKQISKLVFNNTTKSFRNIIDELTKRKNAEREFYAKSV